jgi:hypothetical protein
MLPRWRIRPLGPKFMCDWHRDMYREPRPVRGLDRPQGASDEWRPALLVAIHLAELEIRRRERAPEASVSVPYLLSRQKNYSPEQIRQLQQLRSHGDAAR